MALAILVASVGVYTLWRRPRSLAAKFLIVSVTACALAAAVQAIFAVNVTGTWNVSGQAPQVGESPTWSIAASMAEDGTISGPVSLSGAPGLNAGRFEGHASGNQVTGTLFSASGSVLATVVGTLDGQTLSGTYQTPAGASGTFSTQLGS
jgi:hypothetical protein